MPIRASVVELQALASEIRLKADIAAVKLDAATQADLLQAITSYVELQAQTYASVFDASVAAVLLKADTIVGDFVRYVYLTDQAVTSEALIRAVSKVFGDLAATLDVATKAVAKPVADAADAADIVALSSLKPLSDAPSTSDTAAKTFVRAPATDLLTSVDAAIVVPQKGLVDVAYSLEGPAFGQTYVDPTYFAQDYAWDGSPAKEFGKNLSELLDSTDDFLGVANPDDDQTIFFTKSLISHATAAEVFSHSFTTSRADSFSPSDIVLLTASKALASGAVNADSVVVLAGKNILDAADAADAGSLRMTDYADISYFAQDYVGTSLSF